MTIIARETIDVKSADDYIFGDLSDNSADEEIASSDECIVEWCHESTFRPGLCWDHFIEEETVKWDDQDVERETCLAGVGR